MPTPLGIDSGYVRLDSRMKNAREWQRATPVITPKGQAELLKYFRRNKNKLGVAQLAEEEDGDVK